MPVPELRGSRNAALQPLPVPRGGRNLSGVPGQSRSTFIVSKTFRRPHLGHKPPVAEQIRVCRFPGKTLECPGRPARGAASGLPKTAGPREVLGLPPGEETGRAGGAPPASVCSWVHVTSGAAGAPTAVRMHHVNQGRFPKTRAVRPRHPWSHSLCFCTHESKSLNYFWKSFSNFQRLCKSYLVF